MKIAVFGAGAIGGFMGAKLALAGQDVSLIARGPDLAAMRARELRAHEAADRSCAEDGDLHSRPSFAARPIRCNLPVRPLGISRTKTNLRGTFQCSSRRAAKSRSSRSVQVWPSRSTTAAAMSSPRL